MPEKGGFLFHGTPCISIQTFQINWDAAGAADMLVILRRKLKLFLQRGVFSNSTKDYVPTALRTSMCVQTNNTHGWFQERICVESWLEQTHRHADTQTQKEGPLRHPMSFYPKASADTFREFNHMNQLNVRQYMLCDEEFEPLWAPWASLWVFLSFFSASLHLSESLRNDSELNDNGR